jgi:hypothetical protein
MEKRYQQIMRAIVQFDVLARENRADDWQDFLQDAQEYMGDCCHEICDQYVDLFGVGSLTEDIEQTIFKLGGMYIDSLLEEVKS